MQYVIHDGQPLADRYSHQYFIPVEETKYGKTNLCRLGATEETCEKKLDQMTRTRNALIIALIIFVLLFAACFIAIFVLKFQQAAATANTFNMQLSSTRLDLPFNAELSEAGNTYPKNVMSQEHCRNVLAASTGVATITSCTATAFAAATTGTTATLQLTAQLDDKTGQQRLADIAAAVQAGQSEDPNWSVDSASIQVVS